MGDCVFSNELGTAYDSQKACITTMPVELAEHVAGFVNSVAKRRLGKLDCYTVLDYLRSTEVSQISVLTALVFIEKIAIAQPAPELLEHIIAIDLFVVALMTASKYLHDVGTSDGMFNADWADLLNRDLGDLNQLEVRFLTALNWNCFVRRAEYQKIVSFYQSISRQSLQLPSLSKRLANFTRRHRLISRKTRTTARLLSLLAAAAYLTASGRETGFEAVNPTIQPLVNGPIANPERECSNTQVKGYPNYTLSYVDDIISYHSIDYCLRTSTSPSVCYISYIFPPNNTHLLCVACGG